MEQQITPYFLYSVIINAITFLLIIASVAWAFVNIKRDTGEIIREVGTLAP